MPLIFLVYVVVVLLTSPLWGLVSVGFTGDIWMGFWVVTGIFWFIVWRIA